MSIPKLPYNQQIAGLKTSPFHWLPIHFTLTYEICFLLLSTVSKFGGQILRCDAITFHISGLSYHCVKTVTLSITTFLWAFIVYRRKKHISVSHIPGPCPESFVLGEYSVMPVDLTASWSILTQVIYQKYSKVKLVSRILNISRFMAMSCASKDHLGYGELSSFWFEVLFIRYTGRSSTHLGS